MIGWGALGQFTWDNFFGNYVNNGKWSQGKYNQYMTARGLFPLYSAYADYLIGQKNNEDYFARYGMDWSDVTQPWNLPGYNRQQSSVTHTLNYVSDNVKRLYK